MCVHFTFQKWFKLIYNQTSGLIMGKKTLQETPALKGNIQR